MDTKNEVIKIEDVSHRWNKLREKDECSLSMEAKNVAQFVQQKESKLVQEKIRETLTHLADLRLNKGFFANDDPEAQGDIVACEGIDAFLVPCVEESFSTSDFLKNYERAEEFSDALVKDIEVLMNIWEKGRFPGKPYLNPDGIKMEIDPNSPVRERSLNTTESAAIACRVIIHLLTLQMNRPDEEIFKKQIGMRLEINRLKKCLSKAIIFLVDAFQGGEDPENRIGSATFNKKPGSGWSWTDWRGLPPMLFFTAIAVDAFAELELYLIRLYENPHVSNEFQEIYNENRKSLEEFQFCVDMARRMVVNNVLTDISIGLGVHIEKAPDGSAIEFDSNPKGYDAYKPDLEKLEELDGSPLLFYNNLYALLILLWSFGDWDDSGVEINNKVKSKTERALMQLVNNYTRIDVIREVLNRFPYKFYLPGTGYFKEGKTNVDGRSYMDSGFLTLLTRQLVLFAVYGIGDPNVLKSLIDQLYIDLLLNRNREEPEYASLWSTKKKEIFSTQRAVQALTFYYAYVKGKEYKREDWGRTTEPGGGESGIRSGGNTINLPLQLVIPEGIDWSSIFPGGAQSRYKKGASKPEELPTPKPTITAKNFTEYIKEKKIKVAQAMSEEQMAFLADIDKVGEEIITNFHDENILYEDAEAFLVQLVELIKVPWAEDGSPLKKNLGGIKTSYKGLLSKKKK
jgi:hypothetical protein